MIYIIKAQDYFSTKAQTYIIDKMTKHFISKFRSQQSPAWPQLKLNDPACHVASWMSYLIIIYPYSHEKKYPQ